MDTLLDVILCFVALIVITTFLIAACGAGATGRSPNPNAGIESYGAARGLPVV